MVCNSRSFRERMYGMKQNFVVVGGDLRQLACAKRLQEKGFSVTVYGFFDIYLKELSKSKDFTRDLIRADYVLLPLPVTKDGVTVNTPLWDGTLLLSQILQTLQEDTVVFGGMIKDEKLLGKKHVFDYAKEEAFLIKNAQITAEGAFEIIFSETPFSLFGSNLLVTGFGRIGKILAKMACAMGAKTYVAARNEKDLAWISLLGYHPVRYDELMEQLPQFDVIVNTVPNRIFQAEEIGKMKPDCLFLDLASVPGGINFDAAKEAGLKTIWALSLPGKVAPDSSGNIIADTIVNLLKQNLPNKD